MPGPLRGLNGGGTGSLSRDALSRVYGTPAMVLVRLWDFVLARTKKQGPNGYFIFLEDLMGSEVDHDDKVNNPRPQAVGL